MNNDRVKYFKSDDVFYGYNMSKVESMRMPDYNSIDINDAIEFYEIKRYFDAGFRARKWSNEDYLSYQEQCKSRYNLTMRFFSSLDDTSIITQYKSVETYYSSVFWILFDKCKVYNKISPEVFEQLIHTEHIAPFDLFAHKNIVERYGLIFRKYILDSEYHINILIYVYEQEYTGHDKLYLPKELTGDDICAYIEAYIESKHPNINHLSAIINMQYNKLFPITDEIRLKAKRRYTSELETNTANKIAIEYGIQVNFNPDQKEEKSASYNDRMLCLTYSTDWLLQTLDFPSLLNNFIYIFEFVDFPQMRSQHVSKKTQSGFLERVFLSDSSRVYPCNYSFGISNQIANLQMLSYYDFLNKQGISFEDVLKWFFTEYLQNEFKCPEIRVSFPSERTTYAEKCSTIITAFETILKQFSVYVKKGNIDFELVQMSTTPMKFENIPSFIKHKYVYGTGEIFQNLTHLLFSDQNMLTYVPRIHKAKKEYSSLFDLIRNEKIYLSDYCESDHIAFNYLAENDLISIDSDGLISLNNLMKLAILKDLYENEVISKWHYSHEAHICIQELVDKGVLVEKSSLLSDPEINYFNYLLNRAEYCNGLEIRNKYVHGIQQVNTNEEEHKQNYLILLRIFVILAIKINDDLCLYENHK